jgi:hypothetical protein
MRCALPLLAVTALLAAGCGNEEMSSTQTLPPATTSTATNEPQAAPTELELYFLGEDGQLVAATREVDHTTAPGRVALHELMNPIGGTTTQVPNGLQLKIAGGAAEVTGSEDLNEAALAQLVYTLTSFPTVQTVNGKARTDVEDFAPPILVEHPAPNDRVTSPLRVTGNANTFEATFNYELRDASGTVLAKDFVTATSGTGTRGTFDFTILFSVKDEQDGTLAVFELSAENGQVIHERDIPVRLVP